MSNTVLIFLGIAVVAFQVYKSLSEGYVKSFGRSYSISDGRSRFYLALVLQYGAELIAIVLAILVLTLYVPR